MASNAVGSERVSRTVGYVIKKGDFRLVSPNLPQRVAVFGEANEANQADLITAETLVKNLQQVGELYGYGSPIYHQCRILFPVNGDGVGGIPVYVYAQEKAVGAAAKIITLTPTGVATGNGTHTLIIAGRNGVDGIFYDINIEEGDTSSDITAKIEDAINAVLGSPVLVASDDYDAVLTTKWNGLTANELSVEVDTNDDDLGITYTTENTQAGSGTPSIADALELFGTSWNTIVSNGYGAVTSIMNALEAFNGIPLSENPTGRYAGIIMKPFIAITGSTLDDPSSITDSRLDDVTIAIAPAPGSAGFSFEAAANVALMFALCSQNTPHLDLCGKPYPDMPTPEGSIGSMAVYTNRDAMVKKGCSTVDKVAGRYQMQDFVTTYHPVGETPPQFRYCRNIMLDLNVRYSYYLLEQINVVDHVIANDDDTVEASNVVKPKQWRQIVGGLADSLVLRGLTVDAEFMKASIDIDISSINPDRLETYFKYKRSGVARISATTAEAGFNFGTLN
jgi:phage tail sheath gpL-like